MDPEENLAESTWSVTHQRTSQECLLSRSDVALNHFGLVIICSVLDSLYGICESQMAINHSKLYLVTSLSAATTFCSASEKSPYSTVSLASAPWAFMLCCLWGWGSADATNSVKSFGPFLRNLLNNNDRDCTGIQMIGMNKYRVLITSTPIASAAAWIAATSSSAIGCPR